MTKETQPQDVVIGKDVEVAPLPEAERAFFPQLLSTKGFATSAAVTSQVAINALSRQALGNMRLGLNTGEGLPNVATRFASNPATLISGAGYRFSLQLLTQGLPVIVDRVAPNPDPANPRVPPSFTALWMSTTGCVFETLGLQQPIQDKVGKETKIDFKARTPAMMAAITTPLLIRNLAYSKAVFGQSKDKPLSERVGVAALVAAATNPLDNIVNISGYEAAVAKDGTSIADIYRATWKSFIGAAEQSPYEKFVGCAKKSLNGVGMRIAGVAGACVLLSPDLTNRLTQDFETYMGSVGKVWEELQNRIADKGGVDVSAEVPSSKVSANVGAALKDKKKENEL